MKKTILVLILFLAFALRFYKLNSYPAFNADEAAIGYNAYSLLQTGKDEHGNDWPIHFQSFNDYKPGLYFYMVMPFVKLIGLNEWAIRIPGAALGFLTVLVIYFLAKEVSKQKYFAELSALLLAIAPWHIHFSRGAWEVNAATFFIATGVWLMLKAKLNKKYYLLSAIFFVASLYTYHAARIVVPLLVLGISLFNFKSVRRQLKTVILVSIVGFILLLPLLRDFTTGAIISRAAGVGLFSDTGPLARINEQRGEHDNYSSASSRLFHNKFTNYSLAFLQNWTEHYWGEFLFLSGDDIQRDKVPETGEVYLIELVFLVVGMVFILKDGKSWLPIILWLIVAPFAAALTFQSPHALRAHNMIVPLTLIAAYGLAIILTHSKKIIRLTFFIILLWEFGRYNHMYWLHMSKEYPYSSQYGVKELVNYLDENHKKYSKVVVTNRYDQPYILFLFYLKYRSEDFQNNHELTPQDQFGFSTVESFDNFVFKQVDFEGDKVAYPNSLIIGTEEQIPKEANIINKIYGSNGFLYFEVVEN